MSANHVNHKDIQALFRGFDRRWPQGRYFYCRYESAETGVALLKLVGELTSYDALDGNPEVAVNAAFTYPGLAMLGLNPQVLQSFPGDFRQGMLQRAEMNGDINGSAPTRWDNVWKGDEQVHVWVGIYASSPERLEAWSSDFRDAVQEHSAKSKMRTVQSSPPVSQLAVPLEADRQADNEDIDQDNIAPPSDLPSIVIVGEQDVKRFWSDPERQMHIDDPSTNPDDSVVQEHFGFRDGISNPTIAGMDEKRLMGSGKLEEDGTWSPIETGEFLLGYVDETGEIPLAPVPPSITKNGSFMVQRKLEQDVDGFREYMKSQAAKTAVNGDAPKVTADYLAAKMIGRERDGEPLAHTNKLNDFTFSGDENGQKCPLGAHMRRANPRDTITSSSIMVNRHRILRRAITYGDPVPHGERQKDVNPDGQGLMFLALQTNITRQFEFVQQQWVNFGNDLNQGNDRDPVIGSQSEDGRMTIPGDDGKPTVICDKLPTFVTTRGGEYFFLPGVNAFNLLADGRFTYINTEA